MKILAFVDVHGSAACLKEIEKKSKKVDIILCAGDLTVFEQNLDLILARLNKLNKTILVVHGNHEKSSVMRKACAKFKNIIYLHKRSYKNNNFLFLGHGGGGFSTENKSFADSFPFFKKKIDDKSKVIFLSHEPPYKTKLDDISGSYVGSKPLRRFIKEFKPVLVVCGHLHENANKTDKIKKTVLVNPGPKGKIIKL